MTTVDNVKNGGLRYPELLCQFGGTNAAFGKGAHLADLGFRQFGLVMPLASWSLLKVQPATAVFAGCLASFCNHVCAILGISAKSQMRGVDADRIVAGVEDNKARRDRAVDQFPGYPVSAPLDAVNLEGSIELATRASCRPEPAVVRLDDFRPEAVFNGGL